MEYDGSKYQGWQRLGKGESQNTISNKLIEVLHKMTNETIEIFTGCRTEVGVHARGQVINFKTTCPMSLIEMKHYINKYLPQDIAITQIKEMPERFHASLNASSKTYVYQVSMNQVPSVFDRKYRYHSFKNLDIELMTEAAELFKGTHDFQHFSTVKRTKSTEKTILNLDIDVQGDELEILIEANDFLHNMNRMILGFLIEIGLGKRSPKEITSILTEKKAFDPILPCDPKGLFLEHINY